jgi:hypothetical protein
MMLLQSPGVPGGSHGDADVVFDADKDLFWSLLVSSVEEAFFILR